MKVKSNVMKKIMVLVLCLSCLVTSVNVKAVSWEDGIVITQTTDSSFLINWGVYYTNTTNIVYYKLSFAYANDYSNNGYRFLDSDCVGIFTTTSYRVTNLPPDTWFFMSVEAYADKECTERLSYSGLRSWHTEEAKTQNNVTDNNSTSNSSGSSDSTTKKVVKTKKYIEVKNMYWYRYKKKIKGKLNVKGASVKIKVGKRKYKKAKVKGKTFTLKTSAKIASNTKIRVKVKKSGYYAYNEYFYFNA